MPSSRLKSYLNTNIPIIALILYMACLSPHIAAEAIYTKLFSDKAIGGYDTVAYHLEQKPVLGNKAYTSMLYGVQWYFSSAENKALFDANPERYRPQYGGYCAWAMGENGDKAPGRPEHWTIVNDKLYLNYNKDIHEKWAANQKALIDKANQNWLSVNK